MSRQYLNAEIEELEALVKENLHHRQVLGEIRDELTYRSRERAKQLLREIDALLGGEVEPSPKPPREGGPEDQMDLLE